MTTNFNSYSQNSPVIEELCAKCISSSSIDADLYAQYDVKRGLRDLNGKGVLTGLTEVSEIRQNKIVNGETIPTDGKLFYRGININDLIAGFAADGRFGFEETVYLLLFGNLPNTQELADFQELLASYRTLPKNFVRDVVMKAPSSDMMNTLARSILTLYCYDTNANDITLTNVLRQCLQLISVFPLLSVYGYNAYRHYHLGKSLYIHNPKPELSTAENILMLLRPDKNYTALEAQVLDVALVLHAEHGGGNNSTFTTRVVTSSGTDTYSAIGAALSSLKGPKHGGANAKVVGMFEELKKEVSDWNDEDAIANFLRKILHKEAYDKAGLIYGMGHAVYSISDPRARVLKGYVEKLANEKGMHDEFDLYARVERLAPSVIAEEKKIYKGVSANIDFYSGFMYTMLGLPTELYTPLFAIARIAGWSAHRMEELINASKIIRPAYMSVAQEREYKKLSDR
ncbi:MAG: citrate/2-methylcitrate synthase [Ruminococcaceae bacterium]|nr:citrate/2-methylcitrate synthase [Oscillospiraceae bacterium]